MRVRIGVVLLVVIGCTSKPEVSPLDALDKPALQFTGLMATMQETFAVVVSVSGDISEAGNGDAAQALSITLSKKAGNGSWEKVGQQVASANNEASFNLTLPEGSYTLKAVSSGAAILSKESQTFNVVSGNVVGESDGVKLSFSEDSYAVKTGALFDVTVEVEKSDKLAAGALVTLKMLQDDGKEAGMLMQWHSDKDRMQPPGEAISAEVEDGEAVFKNLFVVDDKDVTKLQAVLEHKGEALEAKGGLNLSEGDVGLIEVKVIDKANNRLGIKFEPEPPNGESKTVHIYFYRDDSKLDGMHDGSGQYVTNVGLNQNVNQDTADLDGDGYCYKHLALKVVEDKYAFLMDVVEPSFNGRSDCN